MRVMNAGFVLLTGLLSLHLAACRSSDGPPHVVRAAPEIALPGVPPKNDPKLPGAEYDCNNAAYWDARTTYVFSSTGHPWRASGQDLLRLARPSQRVTFDNDKEWNQAKQGGRWIEATHKVDGNPLYMWYHNEPLAA